MSVYRRSTDTKFRFVGAAIMAFWGIGALLGIAMTGGVLYLLWQAGLYLAKLNAA